MVMLNPQTKNNTIKTLRLGQGRSGAYGRNAKHSKGTTGIGGAAGSCQKNIWTQNNNKNKTIHDSKQEKTKSNLLQVKLPHWHAHSKNKQKQVEVMTNAGATRYNIKNLYEQVPETDVINNKT